jgi:hypothetical protein
MATLKNAPDLTQRPPRSSRILLGGYALLARMLDKGRATINGKNGEFHFNCPLDQHILNFLGISADALLEELKKDKGDTEILEWIQANQKNKPQPWEIDAWSAYMTKRGPGSDPETVEFFYGQVKKMAPKREDIYTWADLLDLDDYVTFGGAA